MKNPYTGEVDIVLFGKNHTMVFDWRALSAVKSNFPDTELAELLRFPPEKVIKLLLIGLARKHPEVTEEQLYSLTTPLGEVTQLLDTALGIAYYGPEKIEQIREAVEGMEKDIPKPIGLPKKKTRLSKLLNFRRS